MTLTATLPSLDSVHAATADAIEEGVRRQVLRHADLGTPVTKVSVDAPFYPGPILAIAYGDGARLATSVAPVVGWRRGGMHLLLWLDGSGDWDYSDHQHPSTYGRHKPRWIDPSHEYLADVFLAARGELDLLMAVEFADWWGLEFLSLDESDAAVRRHFRV